MKHLKFLVKFSTIITKCSFFLHSAHFILLLDNFLFLSLLLCVSFTFHSSISSYQLRISSEFLKWIAYVYAVVWLPPLCHSRKILYIYWNMYVALECNDKKWPKIWNYCMIFFLLLTAICCCLWMNFIAKWIVCCCFTWHFMILNNCIVF